MKKAITDFFACEGDYPDLDGAGALERLSRAIQCGPSTMPTTP